MRRQKLQIRYEHEDDGRWIAEVAALPGVLAYGDTKRAAGQKVLALTLRVIVEMNTQGTRTVWDCQI